MKKLAEISRLTLEAFTSEDAVMLKRTSIEDITKIGDVGLELVKDKPELREQIIYRELRDNPLYMKGMLDHIITEEPELADEIVRTNIIRYAENKDGKLTVEQGYYSPTSDTLNSVAITTDGVILPPENNTRIRTHREFNDEFGYVYVSHAEDKVFNN
ncbi:MAG: hypothetical protein ACRCX2_00740 [Paraclostridium sp.]